MINSIQPCFYAKKEVVKEKAKTNKKNEAKPKEKKVNGYGAHLASLVTSSAVQVAGSFCTLPFLNKFIDIGKLPDEQVEAFHKAGQKALELEGLDKTVTIKYLKKDSKAEITALESMLNPLEQVKNGQNAFFAPKPVYDINLSTFKKTKILDGNTIVMPEKGISYTIFHEIGHSINYNLSKACKLLQKSRSISMIVPSLIALYATISRKSKPNENKKYTTGQKINNFIRNHAGILAFVSTIPMLLEEGIATWRGEKLAKKLVSPELLKKYTKGTRFAFMTYLITAIAGSLAATTAVKVKDHIIEKKELKQKLLAE